MPLDVAAAMEALGAALETIPGLRVSPYPADSVSPPAAVVAYPNVGYDTTYGRATDSATYEVHVLVGKVSDRASRDAISPYLTGYGPQSVKTALETDPTLGGAVKGVHVPSAAVSVITVGSVEYLGATFQVGVLQ